MPLEISENTREIRGENNGVDVIIEDHPSINFQAFVQATIFERLDQEIASRRRGEDGQPSYYCRGDEVGGMTIIYPIAAPHDGSMLKLSFADKGVPKYNLGTRRKENGKTRKIQLLRNS